MQESPSRASISERCAACGGAKAARSEPREPQDAEAGRKASTTQRLERRALSSCEQVANTRCECEIFEVNREFRVVKGTNGVLDGQNHLVGYLDRNSVFSSIFWRNVRNSFFADPAQVNAMYCLTSAIELHSAMSSIGELFALSGSFIAGFALQQLTIVDMHSLREDYQLPLMIFVTLSFAAGVGAVISAAMLFLGVHVTPVSYTAALVSHYGAWVLRPGQFLMLSFAWLVVAFGLIAGRAPYRVVRIACGVLIAAFALVLFLGCGVLVERVVCIRSFVHNDIRATMRKKRLRGHSTGRESELRTTWAAPT